MSIPFPSLDEPSVTGCPISVTDDEREVLLAVVASLEAFADLDPLIVAECTDPYVVGMITCGVPYEPDEWFGRLTPARRMALSRATRRLERAGLVERMTEDHRNRVTHVRPTPAGAAWVLQNSDGQAKLDRIVAGMERTAWASSTAGRQRSGGGSG